MGAKVMQFGYLCSAVMYYRINSINTLNFSISNSAFIQAQHLFQNHFSYITDTGFIQSLEFLKTS